ncbi:class I SAM-dependent methyltransferase [bacterium]|nr:class I SAM-dependent methyltransferase [bacterium]
MSMYDELAVNYDQMIRWKKRLERETPFFQRLFSEKRITRVLELACGSGHHSQLFHKWGCEVVGVDQSSALLEIARDVENESETLHFVEGNFLNFPEVVEGEFDGVFCLGNSIPHILSEEELSITFKNVFNSLKPGGVFVFQNRNYDRLLQTRERFQFPATNRAADTHQIFFRFNDFEGDSVRFNIVHFTQVGERWIHKVYSTDLSPWKQVQLEKHLKDAGFGAINFYGDFSGMPFDAKSSEDIVGFVTRPKLKNS